jgi:hypothetical protein
MIDKWLKAGVLEDGLLRHATEGSPQGGVISPCLSNIFLHHVLDEWFEVEVRLRLTGRCTLIRFADDAVLAFEDFLDAKRVLGVLGKRLARYGLTPIPTRRASSVRETAERWQDMVGELDVVHRVVDDARLAQNFSETAKRETQPGSGLMLSLRARTLCANVLWVRVAACGNLKLCGRPGALRAGAPQRLRGRPRAGLYGALSLIGE